MTTSKIVRKPAVPSKSTKVQPVIPKARNADGKKTKASPKVESTGMPPQSEPAKEKPKLVRDSFTIPKAEYAVLEGLKARATNLKRPTKKSEMLRAGIAALQGMPDKAFLLALNAVPSLKTGRPMVAEAASPSTKKSGK